MVAGNARDHDKRFSFADCFVMDSEVAKLAFHWMASYYVIGCSERSITSLSRLNVDFDWLRKKTKIKGSKTFQNPFAWNLTFPSCIRVPEATEENESLATNGNSLSLP